jgi:hypothetical protein
MVANKAKPHLLRPNILRKKFGFTSIARSRTHVGFTAIRTLGEV